jgi:FAD/FMN-containing dehydrogenase/Fe-S oxidoreductase
MSSARFRPVIEGREPSPHATVEHARAALREPESLRRLAADLAAGLAGGEADVLVDRPSRLLYATDASIYEMEPVAVVFPRGPEDVQHAVRVAREHGVPVLPRGAGTSLAGQGVNHAVVLDFSRHMGNVLAIDPETRVARVQPGVVLDRLSREARPLGLHYPIDPSTRNRATIGGGIGNNSCGAHSVRYGKTSDQVVALSAVLADGSLVRLERQSGDDLERILDTPGTEGDLYRAVREIAREHADEIDARYPKIRRRVSGYNLDAFLDPESMDLAQMIVGSEGTLAIVVEAEMRLAENPAFKGVVALHYPTVVDACNAVPEALRHEPAAVELVDDTIIKRCRASIGYAALVEFVQGDPGALLLIETDGSSATEVRASLDAIGASMVREDGAYAGVVFTDPGEQLRLWRMREAGLGILMSVRGDAKPIAIVEDAAVPPERLGEFVERFDALVRAHGTTAAYYGHASEGCLHIRPSVNIKDGDGLETIKAITSEVADLVIEFGGSLSGEHGDGILRGVYTERMFGAELTEAFRQVKRAFDPDGILNPGKIVDTPAFDDNLRLAPWTVSSDIPTVFDWSFEGGIVRAAEQCNGQGACLKDAGTMCPSFMVTRDEEHSTRGRANLLRQVLNGALPLEEVTGDRIAEALDLCVECKACKSECPSGVDMAKLKYEVLTQRHREHGLPLRDRVFGRIGVVNRMARHLGPLRVLFNLGASLSPVRQLLHTRLGIHRERPLPRFAWQPFSSWFAQHRQIEPAPRGEVVYYVDSFTEANHPEVGRAAVRVLNALGYSVTVVPRLGCCGRPLISKGQLETARDWAARNVERLAPYARRGIPIVGTEPSCILTLRDEYPELLTGGDVAGQALLVDELIATSLAEEPTLAERFRNVAAQAVLHGHCHQKATAGMESTLAILGALPGLETTLIDSACCGMAGSFGFEAEHYEVSRAMAERSLIPAVVSAPRDAEVLVTGVSCRQQIAHFSGRQPRHVLELMADALA